MIMPRENFHQSDQDLLQFSDGELSTQRAVEIKEHLTACWSCRARMKEIETTIADFARAHHEALDHQIPPIAGPHALLRAQLAQQAHTQPIKRWRSLSHFNLPIRAISFAVAGLIVMLGVVITGRIITKVSGSQEVNSVAAVFSAEPNRALTPGAIRFVTMNEVCSMKHEEVIGEVASSLRQEVFQEYGIVNPRAEDYEIDYLIAPGLGGTEDIHNLWPEPYTSSTWNAYVKDALEEHLHQMVCAGNLDLSTAQHDIATDWIAAYKRYFHTEQPLPQHAERT